MKFTAYLLALALSTPAAAQDYLALLSPFGTQAQVQAQVPMLQKQLAQMQTGDTLSVLNGADGETITRFSVPDVPQAHKVRAIQGYNKQAIGKIRAFVAHASNTHKAGTLNLPQVLGQIATYHRHYDDVLLLGSLSFDLPRVNPSIASGAMLPADDNLMKTSQASSFGTRDIGTRDIGERLKGFRFHWWVSTKANNTQYQQQAKRFWHLYLHHQGAELVSITSDKTVILQRLKDKAAPLSMNDQLQLTPQAAVVPTLFERELQPLRDGATWQRHQPLSVAIRWVGEDIDLDIYTLLPAQNKPVYYANSNTALATHLKDVRSAPRGERAFYETIIYHQAIDSCQLLAVINFYSGRASSTVQGQIRIAVGNAVFEKAFTLSATQGNKGADIRDVLASRNTSPYSASFTLADIAGEALSARCAA